MCVCVSLFSKQEVGGTNKQMHTQALVLVLVLAVVNMISNSGHSAAQFLGSYRKLFMAACTWHEGAAVAGRCC